MAFARVRYEAEIAIAAQFLGQEDVGSPDPGGPDYSRWQAQFQKAKEAFKEYRTALDAYIEANRKKLEP